MERERYDVWRYAHLYDPLVPTECRLSLGEGWTPIVEIPGLAAEIGLRRLGLKREDQNPTGSHKDRGLAFQVSVELSRKPPPSALVVSSSGNGAIAAAAYARLAGIPVAAFLSPRTSEDKVRRLRQLGAHIFESDRAISLAKEVARGRSLPNLRPSTHPHGATGFQSIGWEILETSDPVDAVFTFVSSAASFVGLGRAWARGGDITDRVWQPALHAVQGTGASPVAGEFDRRVSSAEEATELGALGAKKTRRVGEAKRIIRGTGGSGWVIRDEEAYESLRMLGRHGVETSLEGAAALAAARRAAAEGQLHSAIVILTGRAERLEGHEGAWEDGLGWGERCHVETADEAATRMHELGL